MWTGLTCSERATVGRNNADRQGHSCGPHWRGHLDAGTRGGVFRSVYTGSAGGHLRLEQHRYAVCICFSSTIPQCQRRYHVPVRRVIRPCRPVHPYSPCQRIQRRIAAGPRLIRPFNLATTASASTRSSSGEVSAAKLSSLRQERAEDHAHAAVVAHPAECRADPGAIHGVRGGLGSEPAGGCAEGERFGLKWEPS